MHSVLSVWPRATHLSSLMTNMESRKPVLVQDEREKKKKIRLFIPENGAYVKNPTD